MGGFTKIHLKDTSVENIKFANDILDRMKLPKKHRFYSEDDVKEEYEFYKKGDGNYPENQFPKDKINSYDTFKKYWSTEALGEVFVPKFGSLTFDCYFSRTSQSAMNLIANFVFSYRYLIGEVSGSYSTFINDKITLSQKKKDELIKLDTTEELEKLPTEERTNDDLQSGIWLCKSWSVKPFWVIYGNVDRPKFMKKKVYVDDLYNDIYRNKKGEAFLLMPLMPMGTMGDWLIDVMKNACDMGLREHPNLILPILYGVSAVDYKEVVPDIKEWYTRKEIKERFNLMYDRKKSEYNCPMGFVFRSDDDEFIALSDLAKNKAECQLLTILYKASMYNNWTDILKE